MPRLTKIDQFFVGQRIRITGEDPSWGAVTRIDGNTVWIQYEDVLSEILYLCPIEDYNDRIYPLNANQERPTK